MQRMLFVVALLLSVAGLGLAGCSSNNDPQLTTPPVPTILPLPTTTTPEPPGTTGQPATTTTVPPVIATNKPVDCSVVQNWNTELENDDTYSGFDLYQVRTGGHDCFDRVVFDINGPAPVGYHVSYVSELTMDGSGQPVWVEGQAVIQVVIRAWQKGVPDQPVFQAKQWLLRHGADQGYKVLKSVRFAGSYEGQSTIGIGVAAELRFRVQMFPGENGSDTRVVVDIAHP